MADQATAGVKAAGGMLSGIFKRDLAKTSLDLRDWFAGRLSGAGNVEIRYCEPTGGMSHEILKLGVRWREHGESVDRDFVVRIDPTAYRKRNQSNLPREFETQRIIRSISDVPVAEMLWFENDVSVLGASFYVMEKVEGQTGIDSPPYQLQGWIADMAPAFRRQLWRTAIKTMAGIHRLPAEAFSSLRRADDGRSDFQQHVDYWYDAYLWAMDGHSHSTSDKAWAWLRANLPQNQPAGLSWGDARWANLMFDGQRCTAVLDWEDVSISSPLFDMGRWLFTDRLHRAWGLPALEGFGGSDATLSLWEAESGLKADGVGWYELFSICSGFGTLFRSERLRSEMAVGHVGPAKLSTAMFTDMIESMLGEMTGSGR